HDPLVLPGASQLSGNRDLPFTRAGLLFRLLHLQRPGPWSCYCDPDRRRYHRPDRYHHYRPAQADLLPDVPVRYRIWGWTPIRTWYCAGWTPSGFVRGGG